MAISGRNLTWSRTTYNVSGYGVGGGGEWSSFMNAHAISFVSPDAPVNDFNGQSYSGTATVTFSKAGVYKIRIAADNSQGESSANLDGTNLNISDQTDDGSDTSITIPVGSTFPVTKTLSVTIGNQYLGPPSLPLPTNFAENPTGMAIQIIEPNTINQTTGDPSNTCPPGPWSPAVPSCPSKPATNTTAGGLRVTASGSTATINLKNYPDKLVTLKVVIEKNASWQNGVSFNIPNASDIIVNNAAQTAGSVYSRSAYSESNIGGTTTIYLCNLDGGDYNYTFTHSSVPNSSDRPERQLYTLTPVVSESINPETGDLVITTNYSCQPSGTEQYSPWPPCTPGVAITKNGGNEVRWIYEDGGGGASYDDQIVTVTLISTRDALPQSGGICMTDIKNQVWIADPEDAAADGNCLSEYKDHSTKSRFRIPSIRASKTTLPDPLCFTDFRGVAGAKTPSELGL